MEYSTIKRTNITTLYYTNIFNKTSKRKEGMYWIPWHKITCKNKCFHTLIKYRPSVST